MLCPVHLVTCHHSPCHYGGHVGNEPLGRVKPEDANAMARLQAELQGERSRTHLVREEALHMAS